MTIVDEQAAKTSHDAASDGSHVVRLTMPAKPEYITLSRLALTGLARLRPLSDELLADLKLALTEATSNAVRHAYPGGGGQVDILYELRGDVLTVEVTDEGEGFDHDNEAALGGSGDLTEGGLGIAIIRAIADELVISKGSDGRGSRLRFVKSLSG
ncbi:MAG TPA: ATP-binding protein [Verrucomicrobiae bacterium]|nr:ATP-binding protein [Verrucomicrobiae bacterium]